MNNETPCFSYCEAKPVPDISHLVHSFWEFTVAEDSDPPIHEIFPDGLINLVYCQSIRRKFSIIFLFKMGLENFNQEVFPGDICWGIKFSPAANREILGIDPSKLPIVKALIGKNSTKLNNNLHKKLNNCSNFNEAIKIYEKEIKSLKIGVEDLDGQVRDAVEIIAETIGETKIIKVAEQVDLSIRQLQRRFQKATGFTPKSFARAQRIRATAVKFAEEVPSNLSDQAYELGFYDQAHFSREFSTIANRSPKSFAEKVRTIKHGKLIK